MKKIVPYLFQEFWNMMYMTRARSAPVAEHIEHDVPYACQFARPEHAELSLKGQLHPAHDPYWQETGATSQERYAQWAFTMCGMASTAMALAYLKGAMAAPAILAEEALQSGVYSEANGEISSMKYKEFAQWIRSRDLKAEVYTRLTISGIKYALSRGNLVIASVNPNVRGYDTAPYDQRGGHLVLVVGYDTGAIIINNPSGFMSSKTQIKHVLSTKDFLKYFAGRGIVLSS